jgi:threonine dehydrogenase-like Zn-dependent dehydrogenase
MAVGLETDTPDMLNEMIKAVRKGGRIAIVGGWPTAGRR